MPLPRRRILAYGIGYHIPVYKPHIWDIADTDALGILGGLKRGSCPLMRGSVADPRDVAAMQMHRGPILCVILLHARHSHHIQWTIPAPITEGSTGKKRSPPSPVGRLLVNLIRTGTSRLATIKGPA